MNSVAVFRMCTICTDNVRDSLSAIARRRALRSRERRMEVGSSAFGTRLRSASAGKPAANRAKRFRASAFQFFFKLPRFRTRICRPAPCRHHRSASVHELPGKRTSVAALMFAETNLWIAFSCADVMQHFSVRLFKMEKIDRRHSTPSEFTRRRREKRAGQSGGDGETARLSCRSTVKAECLLGRSDV